MSVRHRSQVVLSASFHSHPSIVLLSPLSLVALMQLASWSGLWNQAGLIQRNILEGLLPIGARSRKSRARIISELLLVRSYHPACILDERTHYQINPELITYVRFEADWDRADVPKVLARDGRICRYCGFECFEDLTIDHVFPKSRGGGDKPGNLVVACRSCNSRKSDRTPQEAGMSLLPAAKERT